MNTRPQMTMVEPRIRMPVWRRASPKNWKTRPLKTSPATRARKPKIWRMELSEPGGTASHPAFIRTPPHQAAATSRSLDHLELGMRGEQGLREDVVEREDAHEGDHHRLIDGTTHPLGASGRSHPLVGANDRDNRPEQRGLEDRPPEVRDRGVVEERGEEAA